MRNIKKANKAFERVCSLAFLAGRHCSFINDRYHEDYLDGEIELYVYQDEVDGRVSIRGEKSLDGWYDNIRIDISSSMSVVDISAILFDTLSAFRVWVKEAKSDKG